MLKKFLGWAFILFLVFYAVTMPDDAAQTTRSVFGGVVTIAEGLGRFAGNLT